MLLKTLFNWINKIIKALGKVLEKEPMYVMGVMAITIDFIIVYKFTWSQFLGYEVKEQIEK